MIELKERLQAIADYVPRGSIVIDVGTDHAYLPIYLVQAGVCPKAIGVDVHEGPFRSAVEQVKVQGLASKISVLLGDGLKPIQPGQGDTITIAGMGGTTMRDILIARPEVLAGVQRLILQPQVAGNLLRLWLVQNGWVIKAERLVEDDERIYEIIVAEPGSQAVPTQLELELGPLILSERDPLLPKLVKRQVAGLERVLTQLEKVQSEEADEKRREFSEHLKRLQGVLT